eukprot:TRINITY_DN45428_c1_g1_i3.p1 TRINITY_DN45428_c1_g1~~TRINITY_DN45428_c1_g1_i3.p1  ORF type:complete len:262 (+),score=46.33 TRINITY_DN45428_c1_g1_i3:43-786(+)
MALTVPSPLIRWHSPALSYRSSNSADLGDRTERLLQQKHSPLILSQCRSEARSDSAEVSELWLPPAAAAFTDGGDPNVPLMMVPTGGLQARHVAVFAFAMTCAGPFGVENCVQTFGAAWSLIGFCLTYIVYTVPQIMMTSEMSMTIPLSNGGVVAWVSRALGRRAATIVAIDMLVYQLVDLATYPTLVMGYAQALKYDIADETPTYCAYTVLGVGLLLNLFHVEVASNLYTGMVVQKKEGGRRATKG